MSATTDRRRGSRHTTRHPAHDRCVVCGARNDRGFNIAFHRGDHGWIEATLPADASLQGYPRMMHGGIISLLLDAAMTHCLFDRGCAGITARMEVKFRHPVVVDAPVHIRAGLVRSSPPTYHLRAEMLQDEEVKATAAGLFVDQPATAG